jgi:hypothetical protein
MPAGYGNVAFERVGPGAVHDCPAADNQVMRRHCFLHVLFRQDARPAACQKA